MPETALPPVYVKKEFKRSRAEAGFHVDSRRGLPHKIRKEDNYFPPRSMFDRPPPALAKLRRDLKMQRYRGCFRPNIHTLAAAILKPPNPPKALVEPEGMGEWFIYEDVIILNVLQQLQGLPLNLMLLSPGHTPNWDFVADIVNQSSRVYRTPKQCRYRYETVIVTREEGKMLEAATAPSPKKSHKANPTGLKQTKQQSTTPQRGQTVGGSLPGAAVTPIALSGSAKAMQRASMRACQLYAADNNATFTKLMRIKFESVKMASQKKSPQLKQVLVNPSLRNPKHAAVLGEFGITDYDSPPTPIDIALRRVEKMKEKQRAVPLNQAPPDTHSTQPTHHHPQPQQQQPVTPSGSSIVQQQQHQPQPHSHPVQSMQPITAIVSQQQARSQISIQHQQQTKLVQNTQYVATGGTFQQIQSNQGNIVSQAPVSVVLTTSNLPGLTTSNLQHLQQQQQQAQIVSIHQQSATTQSTIQTNAAIQTIQSNAIGQIVSVGQLLPGGTVGTVLTTNCLPTNATTVATLSSAPGTTLRTQRLLQSGQIQEVVLQRPGSQSPTVVSVSGLSGTGHGSQPTQLRLSMGAGGVTKAIPIGTAGTIKQPGTTTQSLFFRPQLRQQLKVIHPGSAQAQANLIASGSSANATLIQPGNIVQTVGGTVHSIGGQKVSISTSSDSAIMTSQVITAGQAKPQFVKQINAAGKQTITRQASDGEMLLVKRQIIGHQQQSLQQAKGQLLTQQQAQQMFASPSGIQLQQPQASGSSTGQGTQHVATLVKTGAGSVGANTVGMTISQLKSGTLKAGQLPSQNQMRQLQLQHQQMALVHQRKAAAAAAAGKMTQITQLGQTKVGAGGIVTASGGGTLQQQTGMATQLIVQAPKGAGGVQSTVTVQQIQQAFRQQNAAAQQQLQQQQQHAGQSTTATGQILLAKSGMGVGRVIPVSVATQQNARQIQVSVVFFHL